MKTSEIIRTHNKQLEKMLLKSITKDLPIYCNSVTDPRIFDKPIYNGKNSIST